MLFYLTLFGITSIGSFFELCNINKKKKLFIAIFLMIIYIIISGLRWNNTDWIVYYPFFMNNYTLDDFWDEREAIDKGFGFINFIVKSFTDEYSILLFILAIIIIGLKINFILKFAMFPLLSILFWFGTYMGDIFFVRQALAISITLIAFRYIVKKQFLYFIFWTLIASTIQISVLPFILAYFIFHLKIKIKYLILGIITSIIIGRVLDTSFLLNIAGILNIMPDADRLNDKLDLYINIGTDDGDFLLLGYIRRMLFLPIELWAIRKLEKIDNKYRGCINIIVVGYMLYFLLGNVSPTIAGRISTAFYFYEVITIPAIFLLVKKINIRLILFFILLSYSLIKYIYAINLYPDAYIPYVNILFS